jgi:hypothetical protein
VKLAKDQRIVAADQQRQKYLSQTFVDILGL